MQIFKVIFVLSVCVKGIGQADAAGQVGGDGDFLPLWGWRFKDGALYKARGVDSRFRGNDIAGHPPGGALNSCQHDKNTFRCVRYISNYDGDTLRVHIPGLHPLIGENIRVRLLNVDTFEMNSSSKCEKKQAHRAKNLVARILKQAKRIDLHHIRRGNFFRIVAEVKADGVSIGETLLKAGLAVPYKGRRKHPSPCPLPLPRSSVK